MEKKQEEELRTELYSTISDQMMIPTTFSMTNIFYDSGMPCEFDQKGTLGFFDVQDFATQSIFDLLQTPSLPPKFMQQPLPSPVAESSEGVNTPVTPNSSSFSSSSNEADNDDRQIKTIEEEEQDQDKTKKQLKPKKKNQKRQREPRFAFKTKTEVDNLDDGYRWRKYGQKAVKNSPFPRSYYRCTNASCVVKKRVERSCEDSSIVVTTYEGTHTHPCPIMPRGSFGVMPETTIFGGGGGGGGGGTSSFIVPKMQHYRRQQQQQPYFHSLMTPPSMNFGTNCNSSFHREVTFRPSSSSLVRDDGLLQDMVPSQMLKDSKEE